LSLDWSGVAQVGLIESVVKKGGEVSKVNERLAEFPRLEFLAASGEEHGAPGGQQKARLSFAVLRLDLLDLLAFASTCTLTEFLAAASSAYDAGGFIATNESETIAASQDPNGVRLFP
jgi:hypothetical protein